MTAQVGKCAAHMLLAAANQTDTEVPWAVIAANAIVVVGALAVA